MCNELLPDSVNPFGKGPSCLLTREKGFTLLEVLIAMLLLMVGMFAWMQLQIVAIKVSEASKRLMIAQDKVSQELEQIKTIGYVGIKTNTVLSNASFGYNSLLTNVLPVANYQLSGIDTSCNAPAAYCVYKGLQVDKVVNGNSIKYYYTIKLAVNPGYLSYPEIAKVDATVYWKTGNTLKNMQIASFVGM